MAVTEVQEEAPSSVETSAGDSIDGGLAGLLATADHLTIGRLFIATSLLLLVVGRVVAVVLAAERVDATGSLLDDALGEVFAVHLTTDLYLFLLPAFLGLAVAIVPLQVGASTVAFPRAAAASFWAWLLSAGVLLASAVIHGGPADIGGLPVGTDLDGVLLWTVGIGGVAASLTVTTVCVLTSVLALRTAGMTVDRVPMFSWTSLVAGSVWLLSLPVLAAMAVLHYLDVRYDVGMGSGAYLSWAFGPPQVFVLALPGVGVLLDAAPVAAGTRQRNRGILLGAVAVAGVLGFGADLLAAGRDPSIYEDALYVGASIAILLPLLAVLGGVADTLRRGRLALSAPLLLGLGSLLLLAAAAAANAVRVIDVLDLVGTTADDAVRELAVVAGILGVAAGAWYWSTKVFGVELREGLGRLAALVLLLGGLVAGGAALGAGFLDQPGGIPAGAPVEDGVEALNGAWAAGGVVVLLGLILVLVGVTASRRSGDEVPGDPWGGHTLEWATTSPPAPGGPGPLEPVGSAAPLLDYKDSLEQGGEA